MLREKLEEGLFQLVKATSVNLPDDVLSALKKAVEEEESNLARSQLEALIENAELASKGELPICQDTGMPTFFVELGEDFPIRNLRPLFERVIRKATDEIPLRPNAVNPFTGKNSGDNVGRFVPIIHYELIPGDELTVKFMPKGGGSSNTSKLHMISPGLGIKGVKHAVLKTVLEAGPKPCPPIIVGVGIGGAEDFAMLMAKKALFRRLDDRNPDERIAMLEEELLKALNSLGIGPMGVGGKTTVLGVKVEWAHRHPASLPVGVCTMCWASRRGIARFNKEGSYEILMP